MKKKKNALQRRRNAAPVRRRNASSARDVARGAGRAVAGAARRVNTRLQASDPHALQDVIATVLAGGGASLIGGYAVRKGADPMLVSGLMTGLGIAGAFAVKGTLRTAATSIAGAAAGQLALTVMQKKAIEELKTAMTAAATKPVQVAAGKPSNALPPGSFESRLELHGQFADDAARFTEPEAEYAYYADAAA